MTEDTYPLISVYVLLYNETEEWIRQSLSSVLEQTYPNIELIVVLDNPNNTDAVRVIKELADRDNVSVCINDTNKGITFSRNKALTMCSGAYVACLDGDDIALRDRIETQFKELQERQLDLIGGYVQIIGSEDVRKYPSKTRKCEKMLRYYNCIPQSTWLARKEVFDKLEGYRSFDSVEDYDFLVRAVLYGFKIGNVPRVVSKYRDNQTSDGHIKECKQYLFFEEIAKEFKRKRIVSSDELSDYEQSRKFKNRLPKVRRFFDLEYKRKNGKLGIADYWQMLTCTEYLIKCSKSLHAKLYRMN